MGIFVQPDWWEVALPGVGTNRYAYAGNDPINAFDPGGNSFLSDISEALSSFGSAVGGAISSFGSDIRDSFASIRDGFSSDINVRRAANHFYQDRASGAFDGSYDVYKEATLYFSPAEKNKGGGPLGFGLQYWIPKGGKPLPGAPPKARPHVWDKHIAKSDKFLARRIMREGKPKASTFTSEFEAALAVRSATQSNWRELVRWGQSSAPAGSLKPLTATGNFNGRVATMGQNGRITFSNTSGPAKVVFQKVPTSVDPRGFRVYTAHPM